MAPPSPYQSSNPKAAFHHLLHAVPVHHIQETLGPVHVTTPTPRVEALLPVQIVSLRALMRMAPVRHRGRDIVTTFIHRGKEEYDRDHQLRRGDMVEALRDSNRMPTTGGGRRTGVAARRRDEIQGKDREVQAGATIAGTADHLAERRLDALAEVVVEAEEPIRHRQEEVVDRADRRVMTAIVITARGAEAVSGVVVDADGDYTHLEVVLEFFCHERDMHYLAKYQVSHGTFCVCEFTTQYSSWKLSHDFCTQPSHAKICLSFRHNTKC
jgi:hypothetical protein